MSVSNHSIDTLAKPPGFVVPDVGTSKRLLVLALAVVVGLLANGMPGLVLAAVGLPVLIALVVGWAEGLLVLFVTAGIYKQDPLIVALVPIDITVIMASLVTIGILIRWSRLKLWIPPQAALLVPMFLMIGWSLARGTVDYGVEKGIRFCTLTFLGILAATTLINDEKSARKFLLSLAGLAVVLTLYALRSPEVTSEGRLTVQGSSPISLGRMAALAMAFGWLRLHFARRAFDRFLAVGTMAMAAYGVLAAGSRGPMLSLLATMMLISFVSFRAHGKGPISMRMVLLIGVGALVLVALGALPELPLYRFQLLFSEQKGTSILLRGLLFATAFKLMLANPLGLGIGGFSKYAVLELRYPHNLFLEVGSELGWVPLVALLILVLWVVKAIFEIIRMEYGWQSQFISVVVLTGLMNAMVTGDLNDNRMLFAVLLLPFLYRRVLQLGQAAAGTR